MFNVKFNYIPNIKYKADVNNKCETRTLYDIDLTSISDVKDQQPLIQIFNTGYRVNAKTMDWTDWNGCIIIDIDSKKSEKIKNGKINIKKLEFIVNDYLSTKCYDNFVCEQISHSGNSFHFLFYFDLKDEEKTAQNHAICANFSTYYVKEAFTKAGFSDVVNTKSVVDTCSNSPYQLMYISKNKIEWNYVMDDEVTGAFNIEDNKEFDTYVEYKKEDVKFDCSKIKLKKNITGKITDWTNQNRRRLTTILAYNFKEDINSAYEVYKYLMINFCYKYIDHEEYPNVNMILDLFKKHYFNTLRADYPIAGFMADFVAENCGIKFEHIFRPEKIESINYDKIINLKNNETITNIIYDVYKSEHNLIHLTAGCGFGKTYAAKSLSGLTMFNDFDMIMQGITKFNIRICFITPMTSINRGSFENTEGWTIIDGEHEDVKKRDVVNFSDRSICTTWTSFLYYNMADANFDVYIFDEIHSLYLYNYRKEIKDIKYNIKRLVKQRNKVIMMSGTPSYEVNEFDCYKIKVNKDTCKVNCDVIFYNKSWKGYIYSDVKEWITKDKNNIAVIFSDMANESMADQLNIMYNIHVDAVYNKKFTEDVKYISEHEGFEGQVLLSSVYGQAGINIYSKKDQKLRIYILNDCGIAAIQYANRIRNKEHIDKIIIPYKKENIRNTVRPVNNMIDYADAERRVNKINKYNIDNNTDVIDNIKKLIINLKFGLNSYYLNVSCGKYILDSESFKDYKLIEEVIKYEKQTQILYNRLLDNNFNVNFINLDEDVKDIADKKRKNLQRFSGQMANFNFDTVKEKKNGELWIDIKDTCMYKTTTEKDIYNIEFILNYMKNKYTDLWKDMFTARINSIINNKGNITKKDVEHLRKIYELNENLDKLQDTYFISRLMGYTPDDKNDLVQMAAMYVCLLADSIDDAIDMAEEVYKDMAEYKSMIEKNWMLVETANMQDPNKVYVNNYNIESRKNIYAKVYNFLNNKHNKRNAESKQQKIKINGKIYSSINEAADKLNITRMTINRWTKTGKAKYID